MTTKTKRPRGNVVDPVVYESLNKPRAAVFRAAAGNIGTGGAAQVITWDSLDYDTDGMWDPAHPTILTCRTTGLYVVTTAIVWPANSTNFRQLWIGRNGALSFGNIIQPQAVTISSQELTAQTELYAGDTLCTFAAQNTGVVLTLPANGTMSSRDHRLHACLISTI